MMTGAASTPVLSLRRTWIAWATFLVPVAVYFTALAVMPARYRGLPTYLCETVIGVAVFAVWRVRRSDLSPGQALWWPRVYASRMDEMLRQVRSAPHFEPHGLPCCEVGCIDRDQARHVHAALRVILHHNRWTGGRAVTLYHLKLPGVRVLLARQMGDDPLTGGALRRYKGHGDHMDEVCAWMILLREVLGTDAVPVILAELDGDDSPGTYVPGFTRGEVDHWVAWKQTAFARVSGIIPDDAADLSDEQYRQIAQLPDPLRRAARDGSPRLSPGRGSRSRGTYRAAYPLHARLFRRVVSR